MAPSVPERTHFQQPEARQVRLKRNSRWRTVRPRQNPWQARKRIRSFLAISMAAWTFLRSFREAIADDAAARYEMIKERLIGVIQLWRQRLSA